MPNVKQGEDQSNIIEIAVPQDMQSYSLFLFFALPDGTTVLAVGDYITVGMYHNSGVNLNTITGDHSPVLSICMLEAI